MPSPAPIAIASASDPRLDEFRDVKDAALRARAGLFLVEGRRNVEVLARQHRYAPQAVLVTPAAFEAMADTWEQLPPEVPVHVASREVVNETVGYDLHRGCLATAARCDEATVGEVIAGAGRQSVVVVAEDLTDVDNVGSLFRNALALGADAVVLSPRCCDPLYRKAVRVSMGAVLRLPYARAGAWPEGLEALRARGYAVVALDPDAASEPLARYAQRAPARLALVVGSEGDGLSRSLLEVSDARIGIPMQAGADSLNVATAAAIALHALVQRGGGET